MKKYLLIFSLLLSIAGMSVAQNNPMHGWHTYCGDDFNNAIGGPVTMIIATCYPPDMAINYAGTAITKVAMYSDTLYNAVGGIYTCSIYLGGEIPTEGIIASTITVDVPQSLGDWAEFDLDTQVWVTGNETIWIVWETVEPLTSWPMGVCSVSDPSGNGNWIWNGEWTHLDYLTDGDWTVKTYFNWDGPQPQPQDVYFAGNGDGIGKIWKNNTLIYNIPDTVAVNMVDMKVANDSTIFSVGRTFSDLQSHIWMNDSVIFTADTISVISRIILDANGWTAAGGNKVWQNDTLLYEYPLDTMTVSNIYALAVDTVTGDIYAGGSIVTPGVYACVWKNDTVYWQSSGWSKVNDLCFDGENLYAAGFVYGTESINGAIWQNDSIVFLMENGSFSRIATYDSSIYWTGNVMDTFYVWKDGEVLHALHEATDITALAVNESGVYYAGIADSIPTVWKDGEVLYQPDDCDIINALCVKPAPPQPTFTITVESDNPDWGTVSGGGEFHYGDTIQIEALPFIGHEFIAWNDGNVNSPREIVVTQDSTFVALFAISQYTITVESDHPDWGSVAGGGTYYYGDTIEISATSNLGFEFLGWNDGNTDNPRTVIVAEDLTFTAHFGIIQCLITTEVVPEGAGTIEGGGIYDYGATAHLVVLTNTGYEFVTWDDGETDNPRTIVVEGDATYTAIFKPLQYEITTECDPVEGGTVTGAGVYDYGTTATLTATPNENYIFICWSDGIASNPRNVTVTGNANYKALFLQNGTPSYTITVVSNNLLLGSVSGGGVYPEGTIIEISATPNPLGFFNGWDDGNTDNPRSVTVTHDMTFTALFEPLPPPVETYTIIVRSENPLTGSVYGGGTYYLNDVINIGAVPSNGFYFSGWQDGDMNNPRTIIVTGDAEYIASFSPNPVETYTVTVYYDETQGFIIGAGTYVAGATANIAAIPADGFFFKKWSDNTTDNPKEVLVDHDIVLTAFFDHTGVDENGNIIVDLYPNPANDKIRIEGLEGENKVQIYNAFGTLVKTMEIIDDEEISVGGLPAGIYFVRINFSHTIRFVKE